MTLRIGLVVNPLAGVGGPAAMKGSDGAEAQTAATALGLAPPAPLRIARLLRHLGDAGAGFTWLTATGALGGTALARAGLSYTSVPTELAGSRGSTAADTRALVVALVHSAIDLLLFVGGDGTARDVLDALHGEPVPVLGVPSGVKMHSGVFATSPERAADLLVRLAAGGLVSARLAEVRDIDEQALRAGALSGQHYGELWVPAPGGYLQHVKAGGREREELVLLEIAAELQETLTVPGQTLVFGPGSTCDAVKSAFGAGAPTLLGFDVRLPDGSWQLDANAATLAALPPGEHCVHLVLSFIRNQGFLLGRGNQQLRPELLARLKRRDVTVVGSRTKLATLAGRPLLVDSGSAAVDAQFVGLVPVVSGYADRLWYRVERA